MDYEMASVENARNDSDLLRNLEWQIDSEWVKLPPSSASLPSGNGKKRNKNSSLRGAKPSFAFTQNTKGDRLLFIEDQAFRFSKKTDSGFSYWVCNIPFCNARCFLDQTEKEIIRYAGEHNHDTSVCRPEHKSFIHALKVAVKEKPHVKPREIYDNEFEKMKKLFVDSGIKKSGSDIALPTFDDVRTAMYNTRNAVLSSVSLKATEEIEGDIISKQQGSTRSTRSKEGKVVGKKKTPTKSPMALSPADLEELGTEEDRSEEWAITSSNELLDDSNFCFLPSHPDNQMLIVNDFLLHQNKLQHAGYSYWECCQKECNFRAEHSSQHKNVIKSTGAHNHSPQDGSLRKWKFITTVRTRMAKNPNLTPKEIYEAEVERIKRQIGEEISVQWKIPSFSFVKNYLCDERNITNEYIATEEEICLPSTIEEVAKRSVTQAEKGFLDDPSEQPEEISGMNLPLLAPKLIKSKNFPEITFYFIPSRKGRRILVVNDFTLHLNTKKSSCRSYWKCTLESCTYRCVYNDETNDIIKVTGKHTHMTNIHQLRTREFIHMLKARLLENPTLTPKMVYEEEIEKLKNTDSGGVLTSHMPAFASIRTSLYNLKNKKSYETPVADFNNSFSSAFLDNEKAQDISPKAITHLSLEDNENMEYDHDIQGEAFPHQALSSSLEIATPSLYDNHDIIDQISDGNSSEKMSSNQLPQHNEELEQGIHMESRAEQDSYTAMLVPTNRGGQALAVNDCILRSSFTRDSVTYWRCQQKECSFKCSYDTKTNKLLRVSGKHSHTINPWNVHIRSFVKRLKKRILQGCHMPLKQIYEEEIGQLVKEGKKDGFISQLPTFESLKTALYKVKRQSLSLASAGDLLECSDDLNTQKGTQVTSYQESEKYSLEHSRTAYEDPPEDAIIDMIYGPLYTQLPSWLGRDPEKQVIDGHMLIKKSSTDTSTGWICSKKGCLFRCVIDNESKTVLKGKWYHTHRSEVKHVISQTVYGALKRRVVTATKLNPKQIYDEERRRMENKLEKNTALMKFFPTYAQAYQLMLKARTKHMSCCKQENSPKPNTSNQSVIRISNSESQNFASSNNSIMTDTELAVSLRNDRSSKLTSSSRFPQDSHQDLRNASLSQNKILNGANEGVACVEEMEPSFGYNDQHLHQLADFDYPIGDPSIYYEPLVNHNPSRHESSTNNHLSSDHELTFNTAPVASLTRPNQEGSTAETNLRYHNYTDGHVRNFHPYDYHSSDRQQTLSSQFSHDTLMIQETRITSSNSHSSQQMTSDHTQAPHPPHNQSSLPTDSGTSNLYHETISFLPSSFSMTSSITSSSSVFTGPSSQQSSIYQYNTPQQSPVDKNAFTLHGYHVFPASAQSGNIYWQCRVPDCHFQCVYTVGSGQIVQISGNHNHEPPYSQQTLSSQVTKMLLRKAVEDLDKPIHTVYSDYMQALHNLLDSNSIFSGFPRYEDVAMAMQNARAAMGINPDVDPKLTLLQPSQSKNIIESSSQDQEVPAHGADNETYADFILDSTNNRLILHGEEMLFLWRQNEILNWRCRKSDCSFKCVYDEDIQSLHVLNHHSSHCALSLKEIHHSSATKRRNQGDIFSRSSKCPRLDQ